MRAKNLEAHKNFQIWFHESICLYKTNEKCFIQIFYRDQDNRLMTSSFFGFRNVQTFQIWLCQSKIFKFDFTSQFFFTKQTKNVMYKFLTYWLMTSPFLDFVKMQIFQFWLFQSFFRQKVDRKCLVQFFSPGQNNRVMMTSSKFSNSPPAFPLVNVGFFPAGVVKYDVIPSFYRKIHHYIAEFLKILHKIQNVTYRHSKMSLTDILLYLTFCKNTSKSHLRLKATF